MFVNVSISHRLTLHFQETISSRSQSVYQTDDLNLRRLYALQLSYVREMSEKQLTQISIERKQDQFYIYEGRLEACEAWINYQIARVEDILTGITQRGDREEYIGYI